VSTDCLEGFHAYLASDPVELQSFTDAVRYVKKPQNLQIVLFSTVR